MKKFIYDFKTSQYVVPNPHEFLYKFIYEKFPILMKYKSELSFDVEDDETNPDKTKLISFIKEQLKY